MTQEGLNRVLIEYVEQTDILNAIVERVDPNFIILKRALHEFLEEQKRKELKPMTWKDISRSIDREVKRLQDEKESRDREVEELADLLESLSGVE